MTKLLVRTRTAASSSDQVEGAQLLLLAMLLIISLLALMLQAQAGSAAIPSGEVSVTTSSCTAISPSEHASIKTSRDDAKPSLPCKALGCCTISCHAPAELGSPVASPLPVTVAHPFVADGGSAPGQSSSDTFRPPIA